MQKLVEDYRGKGVATVAIQPNDPSAILLSELGYTDVSDSLEEMKIRAEDRQFNFPYLYDGETQQTRRRTGRWRRRTCSSSTRTASCDTKDGSTTRSASRS